MRHVLNAAQRAGADHPANHEHHRGRRRGLPPQDVREAGDGVCERSILAPCRDQTRAGNEPSDHRFGRGDGAFGTRAQGQ